MGVKSVVKDFFPVLVSVNTSLDTMPQGSAGVRFVGGVSRPRVMLTSTNAPMFEVVFVVVLVTVRIDGVNDHGIKQSAGSHAIVLHEGVMDLGIILLTV